MIYRAYITRNTYEAISIRPNKESMIKAMISSVENYGFSVEFEK